MMEKGEIFTKMMDEGLIPVIRVASASEAIDVAMRSRWAGLASSRSR